MENVKGLITLKGAQRQPLFLLWSGCTELLMSVHPQRSIWLLARMCHTDTAYYEEKEARLNKTPEKEARIKCIVKENV